jgi:hypothetical protein
MRERSFVRRNKRVQMREITDLVALRKEDAGEDAARGGGIPDQLAYDIPQSQLGAFEQAGWVFQERGAGEPAKDKPQAQVFVKSGGRLALCTNMLTVKFPSDLSEEEANRVLSAYGSRVVERLTFAPGLFRAAVTDQTRGDALDVANQLSDSGLVEFAEPELIEMTGPRSP